MLGGGGCDRWVRCRFLLSASSLQGGVEEVGLGLAFAGTIGLALTRTFALAVGLALTVGLAFASGGLLAVATEVPATAGSSSIAGVGAEEDAGKFCCCSALSLLPGLLLFPIYYLPAALFV